MASLYERIGGEAAVMAAVDRFYERVLQDELLKPFFEDLDMEAQSRKLVAFMARAFGGPAKYQGRDLREAHAELVAERGLADVHFDAIGAQLEATLEELSVGRELIDEVLELVDGTRDQVLGR